MINLEFFALASDAKSYGGKVIVEVERVTQYGTMDPRTVEIPGILVDAVSWPGRKAAGRHALIPMSSSSVGTPDSYSSYSRMLPRCIWTKGR